MLTSALTRTEAEKILGDFTCIERTGIEPTSDYGLIRAAVLLVAEHSDYQIVGICADTAEQALAALTGYLSALGYEEIPEVRTIPGTVYLKFNPKSGRAQMELYFGEHRGVLLSCQSAYEDGVNETFGHLPLDLFQN
jgi:hypothetical protein